MIICLCDTFSRPHYTAAVKQSSRSSPSFAPRAEAASGDGPAAEDDEPDVEPSDSDVSYVQTID